MFYPPTYIQCNTLAQPSPAEPCMTKHANNYRAPSVVIQSSRLPTSRSTARQPLLSNAGTASTSDKYAGNLQISCSHIIRPDALSINVHIATSKNYSFFSTLIANIQDDILHRCLPLAQVWHHSFGIQGSLREHSHSSTSLLGGPTVPPVSLPLLSSASFERRCSCCRLSANCVRGRAERFRLRSVLYPQVRRSKGIRGLSSAYARSRGSCENSRGRGEVHRASEIEGSRCTRAGNYDEAVLASKQRL